MAHKLLSCFESKAWE